MTTRNGDLPHKVVPTPQIRQAINHCIDGFEGETRGLSHDAATLVLLGLADGIAREWSHGNADEVANRLRAWSRELNRLAGIYDAFSRHYERG